MQDLKWYQNINSRKTLSLGEGQYLIYQIASAANLLTSNNEAREGQWTILCQQLFVCFFFLITKSRYLLLITTLNFLRKKPVVQLSAMCEVDFELLVRNARSTDGNREN